MDVEFYYVSLLLPTIIFLVVLAPRLTNKRTRLHLPPGPSPLPLIGNLLQLAFSPIPHRVLRDMAQKHGPLMYLKLGEIDTYVVSSPEVATQVMKTHDHIFADRPTILALKSVGYGGIGVPFTRYGDYWRQVRKICSVELLSHKRVESFRSIREEEVKGMIRAITSYAGQTINLSEMIFTLTFGITSRALFGKKSKDQEDFRSFVTEIVPLITGFSIADLYPSSTLIQLLSGTERKLERSHLKQDKIIQNILDEHRRKETAAALSGEEAVNEDLVDVLLRIQKDGDLQFPMEDNNIKAITSDLFGTGSETSSTTVDWAMSELLKNPRTMRIAQAEVRKAFDEKGYVEETSLDKLKYLQAVIKEALRLHCAVPLLVPRESREECEINGYVIPAKSRVIVNAWAMARDPKYWHEAEKFNPDRFLNSEVDYKGMHFEYIPFGAGRRACPAMSYAHANIQLPLANLLYHFDWKLPSRKKPEELDMTEAFGLAVRRRDDLHVIPLPYHPSPAKLFTTTAQRSNIQDATEI